MFDLVIRDAEIFDGTGSPSWRGDVALAAGRIAALGRLGPCSSREELRADGRVVCPGFIDIHSHADVTLYRADHAEVLAPLVLQGITTVVAGNCGMGLAPLGTQHRQAVLDYIEVFTQRPLGPELNWSDSAGLFDRLEHQGVLLNVALLTPHALLRLGTCGSVARPATSGELADMAHALEVSLEAGTIGLSLGLQYFPGSQSDQHELVELARIVARHGGMVSCHLRDYSVALERAIDELAGVAAASDVTVQISHLHALPEVGPLFPALRKGLRLLSALHRRWPFEPPLRFPLASALERVRHLRQRGLRLGADVMPTTTGFTHLLAMFPPWALEGPAHQVLANLADPEVRARLRRSIHHGRPRWPHREGDDWSLNLIRSMGWEGIRIMAVATERNRELLGLSLAELGERRTCDPLDAACELLLEENGQVLIFMAMTEPEDPMLDQAFLPGLLDLEASVSTDTILLGQGIPSPLFHNCYPRYLGRFVRDQGRLPLSAALRKITALPASQAGLQKRGQLRKGWPADLLVLDPADFEDRSSFAHPAVSPAGLALVCINGTPVVRDGTLVPGVLAGTVLRRGT